MTLAEEVIVLNRFRHRGFARWYEEPRLAWARPGDCSDPYNDLDSFEAVAIAEKYVRDQVVPDAARE